MSHLPGKAEEPPPVRAGALRRPRFSATRRSGYARAPGLPPAGSRRGQPRDPGAHRHQHSRRPRTAPWRLMMRTTIDRRLYDAVNRLPHTPYLDEQVTLLSDLGKGAGWVAGAIWLALRDGHRGRRAAVASA